MLENQFIQFGDVAYISDVSVTPIRIDSVLYSEYPIKIYVKGSVTSISVISPSGTVLNTESYTAATTSYVSRNISSLLLGAGIAVGDKFALKSYDGIAYRYSGYLVRVPDDGMAHVRYSCYEDALGFPFSDDDGEVAFTIPLLLKSPQLVQDEKTYVKANGEVVTLYAKYYREWEGETEYLSAATHDKIVAALSCDEVYIDGKRVTKSEKYEIAWDAYDLDCDGVTKLAKATFKVREHITQRNSNY